MTVKRQTFDNGAQGDTITAANSTDSGDAITTIVTANGKGIYAARAAIRGAKGAHVTGNTNDTFQLELDNTSAGSGTASVFFRINAYPTTGGSFFRLRSSAGHIAMFYMFTTGAIAIQNSVGTGLKNFLSNTPLSLNTVYRVALQAVPNASTTAGYIAGQLYDETGTLLDSYASGSVNAGTTLDVDNVQAGKLVTASDGFDMDFDDLAFNTGNTNQIDTLPFFRRNTAEGGSEGTAATPANSGGASGTAFSSVTTGTGSIVFSSEQAHTGMYAYKIAPGSGSNAYVHYFFSSAINLMRVSANAYVYLTAYPSASTQWLCIGQTNVCGNFCLGSNGRPFVQDNVGTVNTGTSALPLDTWLRLEITVEVGTTSSNGTIIANIYDGDSSTVLYAYSSTGRNTGTTPLTYASIGKVSNAGDWATMYIDDFTVTDEPAPVPINTALAPWVFA